MKLYFLIFLLSGYLLIGMEQQSISDKQEINENTSYERLKEHLFTYYHLDSLTIDAIIMRCSLLFEHQNGNTIIKEFIEKSSTLIHQIHEYNSTDFEYDAVLKASAHHEILFENQYIRILYGATKPGIQEPFHMHYWKSLMVIIQGPPFLIEYADGTKEEGYWPVGVYELSPDTQPIAYTNIGDSDYIALIFEFKT